jgi:hypothetical protein
LTGCGAGVGARSGAPAPAEGRLSRPQTPVMVVLGFGCKSAVCDRGAVLGHFAASLRAGRTRRDRGSGGSKDSQPLSPWQRSTPPSPPPVRRRLQRVRFPPPNRFKIGQPSRISQRADADVASFEIGRGGRRSASKGMRQDPTARRRRVGCLGLRARVAAGCRAWARGPAGRWPVPHPFEIFAEKWWMRQGLNL